MAPTTFGVGLDSTTLLDLTVTDTLYSEWTLINVDEEDEDVIGFSVFASHGETILDYDAEFSMGVNTSADRTDGANSTSIDTSVIVSSVSMVDSTHSTYDSIHPDRELVSEEVVETEETFVNGSFSTDTIQTTITHTTVDGSSHSVSADTGFRVVMVAEAGDDHRKPPAEGRELPR